MKATYNGKEYELEYHHTGMCFGYVRKRENGEGVTSLIPYEGTRFKGVKFYRLRHNPHSTMYCYKDYYIVRATD